jgi:pyruvate-formate lyase
MDKLDLSDYRNLKKYYFYQSILIVIQAVKNFAARYAALAEAQAKEADPQRASELLEMARILRKVPYEPASTFREAVQSCGWYIWCCRSNPTDIPCPTAAWISISTLIIQTI